MKTQTVEVPTTIAHNRHRASLQLRIANERTSTWPNNLLNDEEQLCANPRDGFTSKGRHDTGGQTHTDDGAVKLRGGENGTYPQTARHKLHGVWEEANDGAAARGSPQLMLRGLMGGTSPKSGKAPGLRACRAPCAATGFD